VKRTRRLTRAAVAAAVTVAGLVAIGPSADASSATTCSQSVHTDWSTGTWHHNSVTGGGGADWARFHTTASSWVIVTLGGLTGDLTLSLYDANCHRLATSQHGGVRYEEVSRSLPAGRYYVRITGAASVYDLRFRPVSPGTHVLSSRAYKDSDGQLVIAGEVLNNRTTWWFLVYVRVTFYNRAGTVIGREDSGSFPQQVAEAHQIRPFYSISNYPRGFDHYGLTVYSEAPASYTRHPAQVTVQRGPTWVDASHGTHYPGAVINNTGSTTFLVVVIYTLYDSHGRVRYVNEAIAVPGELPPSGTGGYDVVFESATGVQASRTTVSA
jgi:hypothetical protein